MMQILILFGSLLLFLAAIKLSFFFSGYETGFYRVSPLQLSIRAHQGDKVAGMLQRFVQKPERFVATVLVGNNIAHYLVTVAIGLFMSVVVANSSGTAEVLSTVIVTPLVFVFGELIPKSLACLAPMSHLRTGSRLFFAAYVICSPLSYPLILVSRLIARMGKSERQPLDLVLSRTRLMSVLEEGHREGLLTELQSQLAENVIQAARHPVALSMIPALAIQGASETMSRTELLRLGRRLRSSRILLHPSDRPHQWNSVVRISDIIRSDQSPRTAATSLPEFSADTPRLAALSEMVRQRSSYGAVVEEGRVIGVISRRTLLAQLQQIGPRASTDQADSSGPDKVSAALRQVSDILKTPAAADPDNDRANDGL